jgi:hypothetical protein
MCTQGREEHFHHVVAIHRCAAGDGHIALHGGVNNECVAGRL